MIIKESEKESIHPTKQHSSSFFNQNHNNHDFVNERKDSNQKLLTNKK